MIILQLIAKLSSPITIINIFSVSRRPGPTDISDKKEGYFSSFASRLLKWPLLCY